LLAFFVCALLWLPNAWWAILLLPMLVISSLEWGTLAGWTTFRRWLFAVGAALFSAAVAYFDHPAADVLEIAMYWIAAVFWLLFVPVWLFMRKRIQGGVSMAVCGLLVLAPTWLALVKLQIAAGELLALLGVVWVADSAAYLVGRRYGKRQLAPAISPSKTWEGVAGACAGVAVYYVLLWLTVSKQMLLLAPGGLVLLVAVAIMSIEGDLFESWIKRQAGVKDSGNLLPGHGGLLDRIDGLTAALPFAALWFHYLGVGSSA
jgi:phosphatidate cytidylyltransferase